MLNAVLIGLTLIVITGVAFLFYELVKVTPEESFASAIMTILILIYITGLFGNTEIALWIVYTLAVIGIIMGIVCLVRKNAYFIINFFSPGILMIFAIAGVGIVAFHGMEICNWDELYQWGKAANFMVEFDRLPGGSDFSGESVLLSSTTFFHYFFSKISAEVLGEITESNYYVSNFVLWFSALILPFSGEGWNHWKRVWGFGLFQFLLASMIFVQPYYNIYTDQPTAFWAGGLIAWLILRKCNKRNVYLIPIVLVNVGLMKNMVGPLFAVIVIISIAVLYCSSRREKGQNILPIGWEKRVFSPKGILGIAAILSPFVLTGIWSILTGQNGLFRFNGGFQDGQKDRAALTLQSMIRWIFDSVTLHDDRLYLSYGLFILITVAMVYVVYPVILDKEEQARYKSLMYVYIAGFAGYFLVMFVAYMLVFGYVDSIRAMSLNRYYSDYMMLGVVPLTLPLFQKSKGEKKASVIFLKKAVIFMAMFCILYGSSDYFLQNFAHTYALDTKNYSRREQLAEYAEKVKKLTGGMGKIYFINQKRSGLFTLVADYEMGEQVTRGGMCYKFRKDTSEPILGLNEYPIDTLPDVLVEQGYEYLWVYSTNEYFNENMKELFGVKKVKNGCFYKVLNSENGVFLEYIGRIK